jgi:hypothetical protein
VDHIPSRINQIHTLTLQCFHFNMTLPSTSSYSKWSVPFSLNHKNFEFHLLHLCNVPLILPSPMCYSLKWVKGTNLEAPYYVIFSVLLLVPLLGQYILLRIQPST